MRERKQEWTWSLDNANMRDYTRSNQNNNLERRRWGLSDKNAQPEQGMNDGHVIARAEVEWRPQDAPTSNKNAERAFDMDAKLPVYGTRVRTQPMLVR